MKILFSSNSSWSVFNFRSNLLSALKAEGHIIYIIAPDSEYLVKLENLGYKAIPLKINNSSKDILSNLKLFYSYIKLYKAISPDIVMHNAIKPNVYGALACQFLGIPVINNISGLGSMFINNGLSTHLGKMLYRISQKKAQKVFFQNSTDLNHFITNRMIDFNQCDLLPGSGIDLNRFKPRNKINDSKIIKFCFVGRLIRDKGINEYIEAARKIKEKYRDIEFFILGELYPQNPTAISQEILNKWIDSGIVTYLGKTDSVEKELFKFDCIVLPSYREGLSRVLLEASSMAIPSITTNVPGCKDVIEDGINGFTCNAKDSFDLYLQMEKFIKLPFFERLEMGARGRLKVEKEFNEKIVIKKYIEAIEQINKKYDFKFQSQRLY